MTEARLFAFGCSFTDYRWPTWADIWGQGGDFLGGYWNMATRGSSNERIAFHINEFCIRYGDMLTESDMIAVMWSSPARQCTHSEVRPDGTQHPGWLSYGSMYHSPFVENEFFMSKLGTQERFLLRDLNLIHFADQVMQNTGARVRHFQMVNIIDHPDQNSVNLWQVGKDFLSEVTELFGDTISKLYPSIHVNVFGGEWDKLPDNDLPDAYCGGRADHHAMPAEHVTYLHQIIPTEFNITPEIDHEANYLTNRIIANNNTYPEKSRAMEYSTDVLQCKRDYPGVLL